jgi:hypothetical protein
MAQKAKKAAKKAVKKAVKKVSKPIAAKKPVSKKPEAKKVAPKKIEVKKGAKPAPAGDILAPRIIKMPPKKPYQMHVGDDVTPLVIPHIVPHQGRTPAVFQGLDAQIQPKKVESGRVYLVEDKGNPHVPSLIEMQILSYKWFLTDGLKELLEEITPITDFSGKKMELRILGHTFDAPKYDPDTCRRRNLSYEAAMKGYVQLINKETGEIKEQDVFLGSIPLMTESGTFIVDGIERVVVHQLVRSPGVFFSKMPDHPKYHAAKIIPKRGVWLEIETDRRGIISCKIDRKRKIPITQLLRVFGYDTDAKILDLFKDVTDQEHDYILVTLEKDPIRTVEEAYQSVYRKIRPGDLPRTRVLERERLIAQREKFSDLVHRVRLKKIEGRRKLEELDADIKQLQRGLNPNKERDQREYMGMRMAREELLNRLLPQAELFESETQLNAKIKSSKNIGQLGRRPRLYDVETLLLGLSMPPDVRIHLSAVLYQPYRTVEKYRYQNVPADTRHSFIKPAQVARVIRALEEELVRYGAVATEEVPA